MRPRVFDLYLEASMEPGRKDREHPVSTVYG